jgi:hypothetical protein
MLACGLALACQANLHDQPPFEGYFPEARDADVHWARSANEKSVRYYQENEWAFNKGSREEPPELCLAISGGGMRSAAFSIGVLAGLHDTGVLREIDVMSSVSGGSWAMGWYYLQLLLHHEYLPARFGTKDQVQGELHDRLFRRAGPVQEYLVDHGTILSGARLVPNVLLTLAEIPVNLFANGLFGWHLNVVPLRRAYERGIGRTFFAVPKDSGSGLHNMRTVFGRGFGADDAVSFLELREFVEEMGLPFPIFNMTANISQDLGYDNIDVPMRSRIFEFTPLRYGSDSLGYYDDFPITVDRAAAISGAAVDSSFLRGPLLKMLGTVVLIDMGYYMDNPQVSARAKGVHWILPFPFYLWHGWGRDIEGMKFYLTDGGHAENLGAFNLVRRMCHRMIIVDAEHDPAFGFEGYLRLKRQLAFEGGVQFRVDAIDEALRSGVTFSGARPINSGMVGVLPREEKKDLTIDVAYIKLSWDKEATRTASDCERHYPSEVCNYYFEDESTPRPDPTEPVFPQEPTSDLFFDRDQFLAYIGLGRHIAGRGGGYDWQDFLR